MANIRFIATFLFIGMVQLILITPATARDIFIVGDSTASVPKVLKLAKEV